MFQLKPRRNPDQILECTYEKAKGKLEKDEGKVFLDSLNREAKKWLGKVVEKSEDQKAVISVLITSLTKKIEDPNQDVRYHREELSNGYSGRSFDTKYVTPFLNSKEETKRIAMKESGWLTRSIEQPHPFTFDFPGRIRDGSVKEAFLQILNDIEETKTDPENYLLSLFILLLQQYVSIQKIPKETPSIKNVDIELVANLLKKHFHSTREASKLPVIAVYSLYQIMMREATRYWNKKLKPLRSHLAADRQAGAIGDIEIVDENNNYFEAVEIKHGIKITENIVSDTYEKIKHSSVKRYYILTTAEPYIEEGEESKIVAFREEKKEYGYEIVINGIIQSIKYYLRLIQDLNEFFKEYTTNLQEELSIGTEIKKEHIEKWLNLLRESKKFDSN